MLCIEVKTEYDFDGSSIEKTFLQKRCDFFQRYQQSHETINTYLEVVRSLAECCNFYKTEEELLIRDRLVSGLNDKDLQLKLLTTCNNPTIDTILSICNNENQQNEEYANIGHFLASETVEATNTYGGSGEGIKRADVNIKKEPEHALYDHDKTEDPGSMKNPTDTNKGLTSLFKRHGWAYPKCTICGEFFDDFKYLRGHLVEHTISNTTNNAGQVLNANESTPPNCVLCNRKADTYHDLVLHYAVHSIEKTAVLPKVSCSICGKITTIGYLIKHMHLHIDANENYPCTLCDKEFKSKYKLARHMDIHKGHETHFCDLCGKKFLRKIYLETHKMKVHPTLDENVQVLECHLCKQQYKSLASLKTHIKWHSLPKNHLCTQCGDGFRTKNALEKHLMRADHDGIKNRKFQCEICERKFFDKTQYVNHRVVHTKERPFKCTYEDCDKTYTTSKNLREHKRVHTGERPYHCNLCEYKSAHSGNLKKHMLVHTGRH